MRKSKNKKILHSVICSVLVLCLIICSNAVHASDDDTGKLSENLWLNDEILKYDDKEKDEDLTEEDLRLKAAAYEFFPMIKKYCYDYSQQIPLLFLIECDCDVIELKSESKGFVELKTPECSKESQRGTITATVMLPKECDTLLYTVYATLSNGIELKSNVYGVIREGRIYINGNSYFGAHDFYCAELIKKGYAFETKPHEFLGWEISGITEEAYDTNSLSENANNAQRGTLDRLYVEGKIRWKDDDNNWHPLQYTKVVVYDKGAGGNGADLELGTVYTDRNGNYSLTFRNRSGGRNIYINVYPEGKDSVVKTGAENMYVWSSNVCYGVMTDQTINVNIEMSDYTGRAFQISQAVIIASKYAEEFSGEAMNDVTVIYPYNQMNETDKGCYYNGNGKIYICNNRENDYFCCGIELHSYASWDVIMHEYNHHVQAQLGNSDSPGKWHGLSSNMYEHYMSHRGGTAGDPNACEDSSGRIQCANPIKSKAKEKALKITYAEAWASVVGCMGQLYAINNWGLDNNIPTVGDTWYHAYNKVNFDYNDTDKKGEVFEKSIAGVLWDFYDNDFENEDESYDDMALGDDDFWFISLCDDAVTLSEFVNSLYVYNDYYKVAAAGILSYYKIASSTPTLMNASSVSPYVPPKFSWYAQGSSSLSNNSFYLKIYDENLSEILTTSSVITNSYTLTQAQWDTVMQSHGQTYYVAVASRQTNSPTTGVYICERTPFKKFSTSFSVAQNNKYTEKIAYLNSGESIDYTVTFGSGGSKVIQTFGAKDTKLYLYDSGYNLLASDDDDGYSLNALISTNVTANTTYIIRVKFYSENTYGQVKLAIVPTYHHDDYESAYGIYNITTVSWSLSNDNVALFRYKFNTSGNVTFSMSSSKDTYLYVIDPTSTSPIMPYNSNNISENNLYDDDSGGNLQAKIIKEVQINKNYLVIISFYNPHTTSGSFSITTVY